MFLSLDTVLYMNCPKCGTKMKASVKNTGVEYTCPNCGETKSGWKPINE